LQVEAATDLLSTHSIQAQIIPDASAEIDWTKPSYVSVLGAIGKDIVFSSTVNIHQDLLIRLHPLGVSHVSDADLADWCRELNNQIVGRMKNKLLRYGASVVLGLPVLLTGTRVRTVAAPDATVHRHAFQTPDGSIELTLESLVDPALELYKQESLEEEAVMLEGALALF
jgi:hypothetical protein